MSQTPRAQAGARAGARKSNAGAPIKEFRTASRYLKSQPSSRGPKCHVVDIHEAWLTLALLLQLTTTTIIIITTTIITIISLLLLLLWFLGFLILADRDATS